MNAEQTPNLNTIKKPYSPRQQALNNSLTQKEPKLAVMFRGGIDVLNDERNSDRLSLCAHSMRELMEKLPSYIDVPTTAHNERLGAKVNELIVFWESAKRRTNSYDNEKWEGQIDKPLNEFFVRFSDFVDWKTTHIPRRREEIRQVVDKLDDNTQPLPTTITDLAIDYWVQVRDFFVRVAHHQIEPNESEFLKMLEALERFLVDRLIPRTFDDQRAIDDLLAEEVNDVD